MSWFFRSPSANTEYNFHATPENPDHRILCFPHLNKQEYKVPEAPKEGLHYNFHSSIINPDTRCTDHKAYDFHSTAENPDTRVGKKLILKRKTYSEALEEKKEN